MQVLSIFYQDESRNMTLHWIVSNEELYHEKKKIIKSFVNVLIKTCPDSIITFDDDNLAPFIAAIQT